MNKFILIIFLLCIKSLNAQVISINPNSADYGQTLNTTITLSNGVMNLGSGPQIMGDVYLKQGNRIIYADAFATSPGPPYSSDTVNATFTFPPVIPPGLYDVHVRTGENLPFFPYWQLNDNTLIGGFTIHPSSHMITGTVYFDANQNGTRDTLEYPMENIQLTVNPGGYTLLTDSSGNYTVYGDTGQFTISISVPPFATLTTTPSSYNITIPPDSSGNDFGLYFALPNPIDYRFSMYTHAMRCISNGYSGFHIYNNTGANLESRITVIHSSNLLINYTSPSPTSTNGDTLTFITTQSPFGSTGASIVYNNPIAGQTVWYVMIDSLYYNGVYQQMYTDSFGFVVSCSVDPNDKRCSPEGDGPQHLTLKNTPFNYLINFQNTGTDTAFNVVVLDSLDSDLDRSTFELLYSSDPVNVSIQQNGAIRFEFNNIMLPDSNIDEPGSHGYVAYRIKPMLNLPDSTVIENTGYIYFDFNQPVVTNTTSNMSVSQLQVSVRNLQSDQVSIYPNPVTHVSYLNMPIGIYHLSIYDVNGREVINQNVSGRYLINNSAFVEGIYYYRLSNGTGSMSGKFIVVK